MFCYTLKDLKAFHYKLKVGESAVTEPYELYRKSGSPTAIETTQVPVEIGMMGFSLEDVTKGTKGYVNMPLGARDSTKWGGRRWVRVKLTAMEDVRANRDIIIGNNQGEFKEHTPVELSYGKSEGTGYQRVTEDYPLPVTTSSRSMLIKSVTATDSGDTTIVSPSAGNKIRVHYFSFSNAHGALATVGLKFGTGGDVIHRFALPASGGAANGNFVDATCEGIIDQVLYVNLAAAYASGVYVTIVYSEI